MATSSLPGWVSIFQAVLVPVIAVIGAWVAIQQMRIAKVKLQHDLYDRRYAVFEAVRRFLNETAANALVSDETLRAFVSGSADAEFLLPDDLAAYLGKISERARKSQSIYRCVPHLPESSQERKDAINAANLELEWLIAQIEELSPRFRDVLKRDKRSRSPSRW